LCGINESISIKLLVFNRFLSYSQKKLQAVIETEENANRTQTDAALNSDEQRRQRDLRLRMDIDDSDIVVTGANPTRISRKQVSYVVFLQY